MHIEYFEKPCPHYIIDDFLNPRESKEVLQEVIDLEPFYNQATIVGDNKNPHPDDCKECKAHFDLHRNSIRDNQTVGLDDLYKEPRRIQSATLKTLHHKLQDYEFMSFVKNSKSVFPILNSLNTSETMLSRYGKCDFYGWHTDSGGGINPGNRVITISYYVNKEPLKFKGGRILLLNNATHETKAIEPKHNRAVIFSSFDALHSVEYVDLSGKTWDEGRFSVQFWIGYTGAHKFR